jgi:hypothetical protein
MNTFGASSPDPWDLRQFTEHYNRIVEEYGGWRFDPAVADAENLRVQYEVGCHATLREFAEARFVYEQQT